PHRYADALGFFHSLPIGGESRSRSLMTYRAAFNKEPQERARRANRICRSPAVSVRSYRSTQSMRPSSNSATRSRRRPTDQRSQGTAMAELARPANNPAKEDRMIP